MHTKHLLYLAGLVGVALLVFAPVTGAQEDPGAFAVTINGNHRVVQYDASGNNLTEWSVLIDTRDQLGELAVTPEGDVYVTINGNHRVVHYLSDGTFVNEWSVDVAQGDEIAGIAIGPGGVYVTINGNHRVVRYDLDGTFISEWSIIADRSSNVVDVDVGPNGDVLVGIETRDVIFSASPSGPQ
jgi:hypothetical protein